MSSSRRSWRCVKLSEAQRVTWRLADAGPHEDASLTRTGPCSGGQKRTHLGTMLLILRVCVNNGLYLRKLEVRLSQNTALVFAKCEEATGTVPSMARRRAFRSRRPLPFPAGCFRQGADVTFNYAEVEAVGSSKRVCRSHFTVEDEGHRHDERCQQRRSVGRGRTTCSWKLYHVCSRRASL